MLSVNEIMFGYILSVFTLAKIYIVSISNKKLQ